VSNLQYGWMTASVARPLEHDVGRDGTQFRRAIEWERSHASDDVTVCGPSALCTSRGDSSPCVCLRQKLMTLRTTRDYMFLICRRHTEEARCTVQARACLDYACVGLVSSCLRPKHRPHLLRFHNLPDTAPGEPSRRAVLPVAGVQYWQQRNMTILM